MRAFGKQGCPNEPGASPRSLWRTRDPVDLARANALIGAPGVGGPISMALEPDRQQLVVGARVGV